VWSRQMLRLSSRASQLLTSPVCLSVPTDVAGDLMDLSQPLRSAVKLLAYSIKRVILSLVAFLPAPLAYSLARFYGNRLYKRDSLQRETIMGNLAAVLGEQLSPAERAGVARDSFCLRACEAVDQKRLTGGGRVLAHLVEIHGQEHLEATLAKGKGAILCGAHFGAYFAIPSVLLKKGFPFTAVIRRPSILDPSLSLTARLLWQRIWTRHRINRLYRSSIQLQPRVPHAAIRIANILRTNGVIGIAIDPPPLALDRRHAVSMTFLGRQILLMPGSAKLADLTGASLLMISLRRSADWQHQVLEISPPIPMADGVVETFGRCVAALEASILRDPAHWHFWSQSDSLVDLGLLPTTDECKFWNCTSGNVIIM
jgi:KDO2-lipid IV(A) lauroyltransferase